MNTNEKWIAADDAALQYMGRIDFDDPKEPVWVFPATFVKVCFTGSFIRTAVTNMRGCWDNYLGVLLDGVQSTIPLAPAGRQELTLGQDLGPGTHELTLFKRQDSCHQLRFHGFIVAADAVVSAPEPLPARRIEVYGDSVSAGEVAEAVAFCGQPDPPHSGEYHNSYYSFPWYTARMLNAQLHDIAQGGIALMDGTGYFAAPHYRGMEYMYDKIEYNPDIDKPKPWDFSRWTPHVVVVAVGQNDSYPDDYMARDMECPQAVIWREHYAAFVRKLRAVYPNAVIILSTTILMHHENWDESIDRVCRELGDGKVYHFLYRQNGRGTPGHIRAPEAEQMGRELSAFIASLGQSVWEDRP